MHHYLILTYYKCLADPLLSHSPFQIKRTYIFSILIIKMRLLFTCVIYSNQKVHLTVSAILWGVHVTLTMERRFRSSGLDAHLEGQTRGQSCSAYGTERGQGHLTWGNELQRMQPWASGSIMHTGTREWMGWG